jgi:hypothetical protein
MLKKKVFSSSTIKTVVKEPENLDKDQEKVTESQDKNDEESEVTEVYNTLSDVEIISDIDELIRNNTRNETSTEIGSSSSVSISASTQETKKMTTPQTETVLSTDFEKTVTTPTALSEELDEEDFDDLLDKTDNSLKGSTKKKTKDPKIEIAQASIFNFKNPNQNKISDQQESAEESFEVNNENGETTIRSLIEDRLDINVIKSLVG